MTDDNKETILEYGACVMKTEEPEEPYVPQAKEMVWVGFPDESRAEPTMVFVVRRANRQEKIRHVLRIMEKLASVETLEKKPLRAYFKNPEVYLCIEQDEITLIDGRYIIGPVTQDDE